MALESSEKKTTTVRAGASRAYRELEATRILVYPALDFLRSHHILLQPEYCAMLYGVSELGEMVSAGCQPGAVSYTHLTLPTICSV